MIAANIRHARWVKPVVNNPLPPPTSSLPGLARPPIPRERTAYGLLARFPQPNDPPPEDEDKGEQLLLKLLGLSVYED